MAVIYDGKRGTVAKQWIDASGRTAYLLTLEDGSSVTCWKANTVRVVVDPRTCDELEYEHYRQLGI